MNVFGTQIRELEILLAIESPVANVEDNFSLRPAGRSRTVVAP